MAEIDRTSTPVRRVVLDVVVNGHSATSTMQPDLLDFSYKDNAGGKADEIHIKLMDKNGNWAGPWAVKKGDAVTASLQYLDWFGEGQHGALRCGAFKVDEIELSGPPDTFTIKAVSAFKQTDMAESIRDKAWEEHSVEGVVQDIASKHGLEVFYDANAYPFQRIDQRGESDVAFLHRITHARGLNMKVHDGKMVVYDAKKYAGKTAGVTIYKRGAAGACITPTSAVATKYSFKHKSAGTHKKAEVSYHDPAEMETHTTVVEAEGEPPSEQVLALNQRIESDLDALAVGAGNLHQGNKKEHTVSVETISHPALVGGITVQLSGWGADRDGTYFVESAEHKAGRGTTVSLELTKGTASKASFEEGDIALDNEDEGEEGGDV